MPAVHVFLMTDLVGSTRATRANQEAMRALLEEHDAVLRTAIEGSNGRIFKHTGDGVCAVFDDPADTVRAAVESQRLLFEVGTAVRMGIDVGVAHERGDDYFGLPLNRCARVMGRAQGGQILVTQAVGDLLRDALPADHAVVDVGVVRLRGFDSDDRLFQVIAPGLPQLFPPVSFGTAVRFPRARTQLIGRVAELTAIANLVQSGRLVSVVGAGGLGKTRLALEVLSDEHERLGGGVFADLSSISDRALVVSTVAEAVGMPSIGSSPTRDLIAFLADRSLLLVVDNCEHVVDAAADLCDDLLSGCPGVAVMSTTREPLKVAGERVYRLGPLPLPDAAALFVERAELAGAALASVPDRLLIDDICNRLEGSPLAIELAAAQAPHLPLTQLQSLLRESLRLLADDHRRVTPRHHSIDAALSWSYDLLPTQLQRLFRLLSVFAAPFSLSGAECVDGSDDRTEVARQLGLLVDKSIVVLDEPYGYRVLETVRAFGGTKLAEAGEADDAFRRLYDRLLRDAPGPWTCWLNLEPIGDPSFDVDNVRGVLSWCAASGHPEQAAALVSAQLSPWFMTGRTQEAVRWLTTPVVQAQPVPLDVELAMRTALSWLAFTTIDVDGFRAIDDHLDVTPSDHPARLPLLFLKAWTLIWLDRKAFPALLAEVRARSASSVRWQRQCSILEGMAWLLGDRPLEAIEALSWTETDEESDARLGRCFLAIACHLAERHDIVSSIVARLESGGDPPRRQLSELIFGLVVVTEAVGRGDTRASCRALHDLLELTQRVYPHMESAAGFSVQAAAVVAFQIERPEDTVTLLAGSREHGLHRRFEGATALGRTYLRRARAVLTDTRAASADQRGRSMTIAQLVALANDVAEDQVSAAGAH